MLPWLQKDFKKSSKSKSRSKSRSVSPPNKKQLAKVDALGRSLLLKPKSRSRSRSKRSHSETRRSPSGRSKKGRRLRKKYEGSSSSSSSSDSDSSSGSFDQTRSVASTRPKYMKARIFVANIISKETTKEDLIKQFQKYGNVIDILVHPKNYAFIQYLKEEQAHLAVEGEQGSTFKGRILDVKMAIEKRKDDANDESRGGRGDRSIERGGRGVGPFGSSERSRSPFRGNPVRDGPVRDGPIRDGPVRDGPFRDGPIHGGPVRDGPIHGGPVRDPYFDPPFGGRPRLPGPFPPPGRGGRPYGGPERGRSPPHDGPFHDPYFEPHLRGRPRRPFPGPGRGGEVFLGPRRGPPRDDPFMEPMFHGRPRSPVPIPGDYRQRDPFFREPMRGGFPEPWLDGDDPYRRGPVAEPYREPYHEKSLPPPLVMECEIFIVSVELRLYAEDLAQRIKGYNVTTAISIIPQNKTLGELMEEMSTQGALYVIFINRKNEVHRSVTLNILHGVRQEHRDIPVDDAITLVYKSFLKYEEDLRKKTQAAPAPPPPPPPAATVTRVFLPANPDVAYLLNLLADNRALTVEELNLIIKYLQDRRDKLIDAESRPLITEEGVHQFPSRAGGASQSPRRETAAANKKEPTLSEALTSKILSLFASAGGTVQGVPPASSSQQPQGSAGSDDTFINFDNPNVKKAMDSLTQNTPMNNAKTSRSSAQMGAPAVSSSMGAMSSSSYRQGSEMDAGRNEGNFENNRNLGGRNEGNFENNRNLGGRNEGNFENNRNLGGRNEGNFENNRNLEGRNEGNFEKNRNLEDHDEYDLSGPMGSSLGYGLQESAGQDAYNVSGGQGMGWSYAPSRY